MGQVNVTNYKYASSRWKGNRCLDGTASVDGNGDCSDNTAYKPDQGWSFAVTFSHPANSGPQHTMACELASDATNFPDVAPRMEPGPCPLNGVASSCAWDSANTVCNPTSGDIVYPLGTNPCSAITDQSTCDAHAYTKVDSPAQTTCTYTQTKFGCLWDAATSACAVKGGHTAISDTCNSLTTEKDCHSTTY